MEMKKPQKLDEPCARPVGQLSPSFLIAQVGAHAASQFAGRLRKLKLAPRHAGILRILSSTPGITQQTLAATLGMVPSQLVVIVDEMEDRGLIERRENPEDRRRYALHITEKGGSTLAAIGQMPANIRRPCSPPSPRRSGGNSPVSYCALPINRD